MNPMTACEPNQPAAGPIARRAFSLAEVVLAIGVVAIGMVALLAMLGPSSTAVGDIITREEASRLRHAVVGKLEQAGFDQSYDLVRGERPLFAYAYQGRLDGAARPDGSPVPVPGPGEGVGIDHETVVMARLSDDPLLGADLDALSGHLYRVEFNPLADAMEPGAGPGHAADLPAQPAAFPDAALPVQARLLQIGNLGQPETDGGWLVD